MWYIFLCCIITNALTLYAPMYPRLKIGEVMPSGWLQQHLLDEAQGLAGHLQDFYADVSESVWIGGNVSDPGGLNERTPYWLNGVVPLAKLTGEPHLSAAVAKYIGYILEHQKSDGWLGDDCCDPWPRFPLLMAIAQYAEANTTDSRPIPVMMKFVRRFYQEILKNPLSSWAQYRWQDMVLNIWWLIENSPSDTDFLLTVAQKIYEQRFDWSSFTDSDDFPKSACSGSCATLATHGVNTGQAIKDTAVWYRFNHDPQLYLNATKRTQIIDQYHGLASGIFSCSEHLAGLDPSQGSETCTVVETMFSYETIFSVFGNVSDAERVELLAYNALPASMTVDQWAHVYLQQSNQINSMSCDPHIYVTDGPDSNIYGLEPNYGCCTVNFPQGWPKFVTHMFTRTHDNGLAAVLHGPVTVNTHINGRSVNIVVDTQYPFADTLAYHIKSNTNFPFHIRIPSWAVSPTIVIGSHTISVKPGTFYIHHCQKGSTSIIANFPAKIQIKQHPSKTAISLTRGTLLYALKIETQWIPTQYYAFESYDWIARPTTPWNYALLIDINNPESSFQYSQSPVGPLPFSPGLSPVKLTGMGSIIPSWTSSNNAADPPPTSPVTQVNPTVPITLIPFGAGQLRIAEFPYLA